MSQERSAMKYWQGEINRLDQRINNLDKDPRRSCFCVGPQGGAPLCPCRMKNTKIIDGELYEKVAR